MNKKQTIINIGGLSSTSKMPCKSFNLSAYFCKVGGKLVNIKNSVCNGCYAMDGFYRMYRTKHTTNHFRKMNKFNNTKLWIESFIHYFNKYHTQTKSNDKNYFRWFDSGDLQSYRMLLAIVEICKQTPHVKHWLPTKEYKLITRYKKEVGNFPTNLVVRVSAPMLDSVIKGYKNTSSVVKTGNLDDNGSINQTCKAYLNNNECGDCRLCWDPNIKNITYKFH